MSEYRDTIKSMAKVRGYMRDLYVYGFRTRREFDRKSARTYDNERRRIESWLGDYIQFDHSAKGKSVCISVDSSAAQSNPLFVAWRSKSYTDNDIVLHFLLLDLLGRGEALSAPEITERLMGDYAAEFDIQTVRGKLREYEREGILISRKEGRTLAYSLSDLFFDGLPHCGQLTAAVDFFSRVSVGGYLGDILLRDSGAVDRPFRSKHHYIAHTLDDGIASDLLLCAREGRKCRVKGISKRTGAEYDMTCVPIKLLDNVETGRRYFAVYDCRTRRLVSHRVDGVDSLELLEPCPQAEEYRELFHRSSPGRWAVSHSRRDGRTEQLCMKLRIDEEREQYILRRIEREGGGGELLRTDKDTYLYTVEVHDSNEVSTWVKTFVGRIISLEGTNRGMIDRFYRDMKAMKRMYLGEDE